MKHFHQGFAPCFLRWERREQICMFLFEDLVLRVFTRIRGPPGSTGIHHALSLWNSPIFFVGLASRQVLQRAKRGWKQGRHLSQYGGFIPAAKMRSAPEWRLVLDVQGELASRAAFGGCWRNLLFPCKHTLLLNCELFPFMRHVWFMNHFN